MTYHGLTAAFYGRLLNICAMAILVGSTSTTASLHPRFRRRVHRSATFGHHSPTPALPLNGGQRRLIVFVVGITRWRPPPQILPVDELGGDRLADRPVATAWTCQPSATPGERRQFRTVGDQL